MNVAERVREDDQKVKDMRDRETVKKVPYNIFSSHLYSHSLASLTDFFLSLIPLSVYPLPHMKLHPLISSI